MNDIGLYATIIGAAIATIGFMYQIVRDLKNDLHARMDRQDARIDNLDSRMDSLGRRLDGHAQRIDQMYGIILEMLKERK